VAVPVLRVELNVYDECGQWRVECERTVNVPGGCSLDAFRIACVALFDLTEAEELCAGGTIAWDRRRPDGSERSRRSGAHRPDRTPDGPKRTNGRAVVPMPRQGKGRSRPTEGRP